MEAVLEAIERFVRVTAREFYTEVVTVCQDV
jgi:hypothetical protein